MSVGATMVGTVTATLTDSSGLHPVAGPPGVHAPPGYDRAVPFPPNRTRLLMVIAAAGFLAVALGIRAMGSGRLLDSSGAEAQYSGTALYASMVYAGVLFHRPHMGAPATGALTVGFCWLVELFQLTGIPAALSAHSLAVRLALGVEFDPADLYWYLVGIVPLVAVHWWVVRRWGSRSPAQ
jgi:Protein of unknown function (DUF2809)